MKALRRFLGLVLLIASALPACRRENHVETGDESLPAPWFESVGLDFIHDAGAPSNAYFLPQIIGSGAALFDYDGDGLLDIYLVQNAGPGSKSTNRLFHQERDHRFTDVSKGSGLDVDGFNMGVAIGDVDNDGRPDVLLTEYGRIRLFANNGDGTFRDVSRQFALDSPQWATSAGFVDYDRDGWLDLVVVNYVDYDPSHVCGSGPGGYCHPSSFPGSVTRLYHNVGGRTFVDVTVASGLARGPGRGLGVVAADFDGDGWADIFVANDAQANRLWINQKDGKFRDEAAQRGLAYNALGQPQGNMGVAIGELDGSGRFALFVTHLTEETNTLWQQQPRGLFQDVTAAAGLAGSRWRGTGFGTVLADFDNDGALDLAVVNGRVSRVKGPRDPNVASELDRFWADYAERNQLFAGDGKGSFRDISPLQPAFCGRAAVSRGLAVGDVDNDGGLDLLVTEIAGPARLHRNIAPARGHWLIVRAVDPRWKRDAYGAEITITAGGRVRRGWINPGSSYLSSNDPRAHFGLGVAAHVESIEVLWPDGVREQFGSRKADQILELRRGEGSKPE
jgi:hypothetical protein